MTDAQRANISKGRRKSIQRKRMSEAMKASWRRRRNRGFQLKLALPQTPEEFDKMAGKPNSCLEDAAENLVYHNALPELRTRKLCEIATKLLGHGELTRILESAIKREMTKWLK